MKKHKIYIKVPGTSANLGPGFDMLGLAVNLYNEFYLDYSPKSSFQAASMEGSPLPFSSKEDLVQVAYKKYFEVLLNGKDPIPYDIQMNLGLPLKGGLGSSASAVVAGFSAARYAHSKFYKTIPLPTENEFLYELAKFEGHPDNTIPAYLGGFVVAYFGEGNKLHLFKKMFPSNISLIVFTPTFHVETSHSRKQLPDKYKVEDVIFNMSRVATWMEFLHNKKFKYLKLALEDKLHTPYRISSLKFLPEVVKLVEVLGGLYSLSGSGPSLLIYVRKKNLREFYSELKKGIHEIMLSSEIEYQLQSIKVDEKGAILNDFTN